jgi:hypothetical protein
MQGSIKQFRPDNGWETRIKLGLSEGKYLRHDQLNGREPRINNSKCIENEEPQSTTEVTEQGQECAER